MTEHTPGKWEVLGPYPHINVGVEYKPDLFDVVAVVWREEEYAPEEVEANARLIAAAPQLLEACEMLVNDSLLPETDYGIGVAKAAIAAAKGDE